MPAPWLRVLGLGLTCLLPFAARADQPIIPDLPLTPPAKQPAPAGALPKLAPVTAAQQSPTASAASAALSSVVQRDDAPVQDAPVPDAPPPNSPAPGTPPVAPPDVPGKVLPLAPPQAAPPGPPLHGPDVKAASAILVDAATGTVLWERDSHAHRPIASTTKIMTATLILESGRINDVVTFSDHARLTPYANLNMQPGEKIRMKDLLYAIMLRSSNDGCVAAAEHVSGAVWKFTSQMTAKAHSLGARDTNFVTPNGLYDPNHYSCAYDLALMTRYAIQFPLFNEVVGTQSKKISRSINQKDTVLFNHNKLLSRYDGADGIKTGYVRQSGKCLVASSTRMEDGKPWRLIAVVLNSADCYGDSARLMDWGRHCFQPIYLAQQGQVLASASVSEGVSQQVPLLASRDVTAIVRRGAGTRTEREVHVAGSLKAPVASEAVGGRVVALVDGQPVCQAELVAARPVGRMTIAGVSPWTAWSMVLAALVLGPCYAARAVAKSAFRRRRRVAARGGEPDHGGESYRQRPGGEGAGA